MNIERKPTELQMTTLRYMRGRSPFFTQSVPIPGKWTTIAANAVMDGLERRGLVRFEDYEVGFVLTDAGEACIQKDERS